MIRVLVVDDHTILRKGLKEILEDTKDIIVAGEAANGQEALEKVAENKYDVIILDINMPIRSGTAIMHELQNLRPRLRILILTMHLEDEFAIRLLRAGASGYLTKESAPEELVSAVRKVSLGGIYISPYLSEQLALRLRKDETRLPHEKLSDREYQIMIMIASGKMVSEIAEELSLSAKTISTYRARLMEKLSVRNNIALTHYAIQNQLISLNQL
ncbi:response regulator [Chloroflexota bacterium]